MPGGGILGLILKRYSISRANAFTRASGRGLEPGNQEFFRPCEMAAYTVLSRLTVTAHVEKSTNAPVFLYGACA